MRTRSSTSNAFLCFEGHTDPVWMNCQDSSNRLQTQSNMISLYHHVVFLSLHSEKEHRKNILHYLSMNDQIGLHHALYSLSSQQGLHSLRYYFFAYRITCRFLESEGSKQ